MEDPTHLPGMIGELTLRPTEEGGRQSGIAPGYRCQALLSGVRDFSTLPRDQTVEFNDCQLHFDAAQLEPGQTITARVYPLVPDFWSAV